MYGMATGSRLLLAAAYRWDSTVPLAIALRDAGFEVAIVAPPDHPLQKLSGLSGRWPYRQLRPLGSLRHAIEAAAPSLVMPCDEPMMALLRKLRDERDLAPNIRDAVERALGEPEMFPLLASRAGVSEIAERAGVSTPRSATICSTRDLLTWLKQHGMPAYVKIDRSTGGKGVIRVESAIDAVLAYLRLRLLFGWPRAIWHWLRSGDLSSLPLLMADSRAEITVQQEVDGIPANCAITAWQGRMLACIAVEALETCSPTGVATVVRVRDDPLMTEVARKVTAYLGLSGLYGLDFILARDTGVPWLIEINGRPTQTAYLRLGAGADLAGALYAAATGLPEEPVGVFRTQEIIALFDEPGGGRRHIHEKSIPASEEQADTLRLELQAAAKSAVSP
jgi:ATP-grasp domain-containing protein